MERKPAGFCNCTAYRTAGRYPASHGLNLEAEPMEENTLKTLLQSLGLNMSVIDIIKE